MKISYLSPNKNVKTFSIRNMKPTLIFTADNKPKDNLTLSEVKKKLLSDSANKIREENVIESMDYGVNGGRINPSKMKLQNVNHNRNLSYQLQNINGNGNTIFFSFSFFSYYNLNK